MNISHNDNPDNRIDKLDMISTTKRRPTKKEYYTNERNELIDTLNKIIGISDKNNYVYLYDLQKNQELKDYIDDNIIQIRKIFKTHS